MYVYIYIYICAYGCGGVCVCLFTIITNRSAFNSIQTCKHKYISIQCK